MIGLFRRGFRPFDRENVAGVERALVVLVWFGALDTIYGVCFACFFGRDLLLLRDWHWNIEDCLSGLVTTCRRRTAERPACHLFIASFFCYEVTRSPRTSAMGSCFSKVGIIIPPTVEVTNIKFRGAGPLSGVSCDAVLSITNPNPPTLSQHQLHSLDRTAESLV